MKKRHGITVKKKIGIKSRLEAGDHIHDDNCACGGSMEKGGMVDDYDEMASKFPAVNKTLKKVRDFLIEHKYPIRKVSEPNFEQDGEIQISDKTSVVVTLDNHFYVSSVWGKNVFMGQPTKDLNKMKADLDKYYDPKSLPDYSKNSKGGIVWKSKVDRNAKSTYYENEKTGEIIYKPYDTKKDIHGYFSEKKAPKDWYVQISDGSADGKIKSRFFDNRKEANAFVNKYKSKHSDGGLTQVEKFKIGDKVTWIGYDNATSFGTIDDVAETSKGQFVWIGEQEFKPNQLHLLTKIDSMEAGGKTKEKYHWKKRPDGSFGIYNQNDLFVTSRFSKEDTLDYLRKANNTDEYEIYNSYPVKKAKYKIGDKAYSWQNKDYPAEVVRRNFSAWTSVDQPHENDTWKYLVRLKDGQRSKWMSESNLHKTKQKEYAEGGRMDAGSEIATATEIRNQIGHKALYMLGAYDIFADKGALGFKIRGSRNWRHIKIRLNGKDLYDVTFTNWRKKDMSDLITKTVEDVYAENLHSVIEKETGLYTNLANGGEVDDYKKNLAMVDVIFINPDYNYSTNVSGDTTEQQARDYFVGKYFNVGAYPEEKMKKVIDIKFHPKGTYASGGLMEKEQLEELNDLIQGDKKQVRQAKKTYESLSKEDRDKFIEYWIDTHSDGGFDEEGRKYGRKQALNDINYLLSNQYETGGSMEKGGNAIYAIVDPKNIEGGINYKGYVYRTIETKAGKNKMGFKENDIVHVGEVYTPNGEFITYLPAKKDKSEVVDRAKRLIDRKSGSTETGGHVADGGYGKISSTNILNNLRSRKLNVHGIDFEEAHAISDVLFSADEELVLKLDSRVNGRNEFFVRKDDIDKFVEGNSVPDVDDEFIRISLDKSLAKGGIIKKVKVKVPSRPDAIYVTVEDEKGDRVITNMGVFEKKYLIRDEKGNIKEFYLDSSIIKEKGGKV